MYFDIEGGTVIHPPHESPPRRLFNARLSDAERAKLARIAKRRGTTSSGVLRQWIAEATT